PRTVIGVTDECDIWSFWGFGTCQTIFPVSRSTPIIRMSFPPGASTVVFPSMIGHCAVYQSGIFVPKSFIRLRLHFSAPVWASTHMTWHFEPMETTYLSFTAGTVRVKP